MAFAPTDLPALLNAGFDTLIDVRSPAEFAEDHIPGAINLPVLSDEERARVGTIYVQDSPFRARKLGAALVARNAAKHIEGPLAEFEGGWRPLVYCWRGGQRSGSLATILRQIGWRAETLEGGYQTYRRMVVARLYESSLPHELILLDGNTGTAKTDILNMLPALGVQSLDLEGLAGHRGSALGALSGQPSQKAFETALTKALITLDPARPVVVEAESSKIGRINLPPALFEAMQKAPRLELSVPVAARADYLTEAYCDITEEPSALVARLEKLVRLQGRERVEGWVRLAEAGAFRELAVQLIERHYDPRYARVRARLGAEVDDTLVAASLDEAGRADLASRVADWVKERGA
ncbi:MAG: tRNA 2-selenouridine(34) synthase MnmH [Paracoccaceae bacterium]|nr:tRNA 2-selenouridine(34) synthase MnmH [Paracoccaceae bacterium]